MAVPIDVATGPGGPEPEPALSVSGKAIEGRSLGQIAWMRLRQDKVAMAGGIVVILLILVAIFGPYLVQNPIIYHENLIDPTFSRPYGAFGGISLAHPFGVEPITGRDLLARVVNGARVSLIIAFLATALAVGIGVVMGVDGRVLRRLGGLGDRPGDGHLPGLPAACVRDRAGRRHPVVRVRPVGELAADRRC